MLAEFAPLQVRRTVFTPCTFRFWALSVISVGGVYSIVSTGGLVLSRVSNRFDVGLVDSSPNTSHPKLVAGLSSHDCTSATICAELQMYCPMSPTDWLALTVAEKSPPCVVQKVVSKNRCRHVASLGVA